MPEKISPKVLSWAPDIDDKTAEQARRSAELPFVHRHVALMPDAHYGYGATIGSVIPTIGAIIPSAVGVDIGCGMVAARLDLTASDLPDDLTALHSAIAQEVPAGVGRGHEFGDFTIRAPLPRSHAWSAALENKAAAQHGTLGSGNHFVEICLDENDNVWIVIHSGSRGVGNELASFHIEGAKKMMKRYFIELPDPGLAYLVEDTEEFDAYITDMLWAQEYAKTNREAMMTAVHLVTERFLGRSVQIADAVNCHHNFTTRENHGNQNMWITRKGAILARDGVRGVIPGSMGTRSYIVSGLGNPASYNSCSHGAGRTMSRTAARKNLDYQGLIDAMAGKTWNGTPETLIDEDPRAYKDIDQVMENQKDLVRIEHTLHQILNYKGA